MSITDQPWFSNILRPSRYLGNEIHSVQKNPAETEVSMALAFPDVYEVGMSHLGLKILYNILNSHKWLAAERVFAPWVDMEKELRKNNILLSSLESGRPLLEFDIIGFSLQHELSYTNVVNMLDMAGIPVMASKRKKDDPLVIGGGPAAFNPEPVADFFDLFVIGDGEHASMEICNLVRQAKKEKIDKKEILSRLRHVKGIYIPSFFHISYENNGTIKKIEPVLKDYPYVEKVIVPDIDAYPYPEKIIVPFTELIHDRVAIEISRGCTRGCRFCQAGMIYRPVRERSPQSILEKAGKSLACTGYDDLSLLSLSSGDYSCINPLIEELMDRQSDEKIAVSLPSLRVDSLKSSLVEQIKRVRKTGFTLAVEAGSQKLRNVINKGLTYDELIEMSKIIYGAGWKLIKLYFMIGLPFETDKDLEDIIYLARDIAKPAGKKGKKANLNVSVSIFVPKSHTPFMWCPQISLEESRRRTRLIMDGLKNSNIDVKWNQPELSWLEGIFSRGDRKLSNVIIRAWELGAKYDAWGEHFDKNYWDEAFASLNIDPDFYLHRERNLDEIMPWDHIKSGVTKEYLAQEWMKAIEGELTQDCRKKCSACGVCDHDITRPVLFNNDHFSPTGLHIPAMDPPEISFKYRLVFTKLGKARFLGHLELVRLFIRALKRAELPLTFSRGFHPKPKLTFACALPLGTESLHETVTIELNEQEDVTALKNRINSQLPEGIDILDVKKISGIEKKQKIKEITYEITLPSVHLKEEYLELFWESEYFTVVKTGKKREHTIDIKNLVKFLKMENHDRIHLILKYNEGAELRPAEIIKNIFCLNTDDITEIRIVKTGQILD